MFSVEMLRFQIEALAPKLIVSLGPVPEVFIHRFQSVLTFRDGTLPTVLFTPHPRPAPGAGGDAEGIRRRERIAQQRLKHDAGGRQGAADERRGEDARQARDEEDLRVGVVGVWNRSIEDTAEVNPRAADERRQHERDERQDAEPDDGGREPATDR